MSSPDRLRVWQAAVQVAVRTRSLLTHFPPRGYAELRDQMIRSSESIANNIGEGHVSIFDREFIRFLDTALRSAGELNSQLKMARDYGIVPTRETFALIGTVICTERMIESLRDWVDENAGGESPPEPGDDKPH
jgi:four helix bundle protein